MRELGPNCMPIRGHFARRLPAGGWPRISRLYGDVASPGKGVENVERRLAATERPPQTHRNNKPPLRINGEISYADRRGDERSSMDAGGHVDVFP